MEKIKPFNHEFAREGEQNIIETALAAGRALAPRVIENPIRDGQPFLVLKDQDGAERLRFLTERDEHPPRKIGTVKLSDAASFIAYWKKHSYDPSSEIYASAAPAQFTAVFDDHEAALPNYRQHRAVYTLNHSAEWKTWKEHDGKAFDTNEQFALWIENQLPDFQQPDGATMLQMALNFRYTQNAAFDSKFSLANGAARLTYTNDIEGRSTVGGGEITIPEMFEIRIPVFEGIHAAHHALQCRLRWRIENKTVKLRYDLVRPQKVAEAAFHELVEEIAEGTGANPLFGAAE